MSPALIVYESILGNTEEIARAVADGLGRSHSVTVSEVGRAPDVVPEDVDLLVVGGPTHAFGLSRPETRKEAADQATGPVPSGGRGLREWLEALAPSETPTPFATFDTRISQHFPGSAAKKAHKRLRAKGFRSLEEPESFIVHGKPARLAEGEPDRARSWGEGLGRRLDDVGGVSARRA
ncbi:MAG TPA: flavodoxin domain-containing protein [Pedococcus sp.]|jgi:flavodoxin|uniref:flavodoxin family protein n=1 Tax=Pedococcus sp. TaxID=2860345 RepID=UPI002F95CD12